MHGTPQWLLPSATAIQAITEDDDADVVALPPMIPVFEPLAESEYSQLYKHALRAVVQQAPWRETSHEEVEAMVARLREAFRGRSAALTSAKLSEIEAAVRSEPVAESLQSQYVAYMNADNFALDSHRQPANFLSHSTFEVSRAKWTDEIQKRLHMTNSVMGYDVQRRTRTIQTFEAIRSGAAMDSVHDTRQGSIADGIPNEYEHGCFGLGVNVVVHDVTWRAKEAREDREVGAGLPRKFRVAVSVTVGGESRGADHFVREPIRQVARDPTIALHLNGEEAPTEEVLPEGQARFWKFATPQHARLSVGGGVFPARRTGLAVHLRTEKVLGCFAFREHATIHVPMEVLYEDIHAIGSEERRNKDRGYHYVYRHFVDPATGIGATLEVELECLVPEHNEAPYFFDPADEPLVGQDTVTNRLLADWGYAWTFNHHSGLLHLLEMCGEISDLEFSLLEAYADRYLLDQELFHAAGCVSRVKYNNFSVAEDRDDAVKAAEFLSIVQPTTHVTQQLISASKPDLVDRVVTVIAQIEKHATTPRAGLHVFDCCCRILRHMGVSEHAVGDLVKAFITDELGERLVQYTERHGSAKTELAYRATTLMRIFARELDDVLAGLRFAARGKQESACLQLLAAHRAKEQLLLLVPVVRAFVKTATGQLARDSTADPFGETFCVLCSMHERSIECVDVARKYVGCDLPAVAAELVDVFDSFLTTWLSLCPPRICVCLSQIVAVASFEPLRNLAICETPGDALHIVEEFIDFFWQAAECAPGEAVAAALSSFCGILGSIAVHFVSEFAQRAAHVTPSLADVHGTTQKQLLAVTSLDFFVSEFREACDDVMPPLEEALAHVVTPVPNFAELCRQKLQAGFERVERAALEYARDVFATQFCSKFFSLVLAPVPDIAATKRRGKQDAVAFDTIARPTQEFFALFGDACDEPAVAAVAPTALRSVANVFCSRVSHAPLESHAFLERIHHVLDSAMVENVASSDDLAQDAKNSRNLCQKVLNRHKETQVVGLVREIELVAHWDQQPECSIEHWVANMVIHRAKHDQIAAAAVAKSKLKLSHFPK